MQSPEAPTFEELKGANDNCEIRECVNPAAHLAKWQHVVKLICTTHKRQLDGKPWSTVAQQFGGKSGKRQ